MKKALIYCRVSTEEQVQNLSLSTQQRRCLEYCERNSLDVVQIFIEEGESAKTADRTELKKLLQLCNKRRDIFAVVVLQTDRWTRSSEDHAYLRATLQKYGAELRSVNEPAIDSSPTGRFMGNIMSSFSELDNEIRGRRTVEGMKESLARGRWTFPPPLGYVAGRDSFGFKNIAFDPFRSEIVRRAFQSFAAGGLSIQETRRRAIAMGLTTKKGKKVSAQSFNQMLRKPVYKGWISVPKWGIEARGSFDPLVPEEIFEAVQRRLSGKPPRVRHKIHPEFPLRNFVRCGDCHRPMTASKSKGRSGYYAYYHCQGSLCKRRVTKDRFESGFQDLLRRLQPSAEYLDLFRGLLLAAYRKRSERSFKDRAAAEAKIQRNKAKKRRLDEAFIFEKSIDRETYNDMRGEISEEIRKLEIELERQEHRVGDIHSCLALSERFLARPDAIWASCTAEQKNRIQRVLFPSGVSFSNNEYRTDATCLMFNGLEQLMAQKNGLVALPGIEPGFED